MEIIKQFYQLEARDTDKISTFWRWVHLLTLVLAAISGFTATYCFGKILEAFGSHCVLNANIVFSEEIDYTIIYNTTTPSNVLVKYNETNEEFALISGNTTDNIRNANYRHVHAINLDGTNWGYYRLCEFCQASNLISMIVSVVWGAFFLIVANGGAGYYSDILPHPYRIVYPFAAFIVIFLPVIFASTVLLQMKLKDFCLQFQSQFGNLGCVPEINSYTLQFSKGSGYDFYVLYNVSIAAAYIGLICWLTQFVVIILRSCLCFVDFQFYLVTVTEKPEVEENVIDYNSDKKASVVAYRSSPEEEVTEISAV